MPKASPSARKPGLRKVKPAQPQVMIAQVHDGNGPVDILMNVVGGKVASVVYGLENGDRLTVSAALLRSTVEMIDGTDTDGG